MLLATAFSSGVCEGGGFGHSSYVALFGPSSNHPGGVMVTRLDGSVHFVADTIDGRLWREMGSIR